MFLNTVILIGFLLTLFSRPMYQQKTEDVTLPIEERIKLLKYAISKGLRAHEKQEHSHGVLINENVDYVDHSNVHITPVMNHNRGTEESFPLRQLKTTTTTVLPWEPTTPSKQDGGQFSNLRSYKDKEKFIEKPLDTFYRKKYRRQYITEDMKHYPLHWIHCQDLITPYLNGMKNEMTPRKIINSTHTVPMRVTKLLLKNVTGYNTDDIMALLYQLDNMQIRLYQWADYALSVLMDGLCGPVKHNFMCIKNGLKRIFNTWHLDYSNIDNLLKRARIFRPPCIQPSYSGYISVLIVSTSTSNHMLFAPHVNEFKDLYQQYVPDRLADIVAIVSEASNTQKNPKFNKEDTIRNDRYKVFEPSNPRLLRMKKIHGKPEYVYYDDNAPKPPKSDKVISVSYDQIAGVADSKAASYEYEYEADTRQSVPRTTRVRKLINHQQPKRPQMFKVDPPPKQNNSPIQVNLDQLVQKVKEKLLSDITKDPDRIKDIIAQEVAGHTERTATNPDVTYTDLYEKELALHLNTEYKSFSKRSGRTRRTRSTTRSHSDTSPVELFKEINLNAKKKGRDSYEDYITPKKEENPYYSDGESTTTSRVHYKAKKSWTPKAGKKFLTTRNTPRSFVSAIEYDDDNETQTEPDAFKMRTETMKVEDYDAHMKNPNLNPNINPNWKSDDGVSRKLTLATMIPTRNIFRITTPNYYGKLPTVAQKYDFNEPIPEKDREPEIIKPLGPPPMIVNGKKLVAAVEVTNNKAG